jgi:hypothetical protein
VTGSSSVGRALSKVGVRRRYARICTKAEHESTTFPSWSHSCPVGKKELENLMSVSQLNFSLPETVGERICAALLVLTGGQVPSSIIHVVDEWDGPLPLAIRQDHIRLHAIAGGTSETARKTLLRFPKGTQITYREASHLRTLHLIKTFVLPNGNEHSFIYEQGKRGRYYRYPDGIQWHQLDEELVRQRLLELIVLRAVPVASDIAILDRCLLDLDLLAP